MADQWDPAAFGLTPVAPPSATMPSAETSAATQGGQWDPAAFGLTPAALTTTAPPPADAPSPFSVQGIRNAIASPPGYVSSGILPIAVKEDPNRPGYGDMNAGVKLDWGPIRSVVNPLLDLLEGTGLATSAGGENSPLAGKVSPAASALLFSTMAGNPNPLQSTASVMRVPFPGPRVAAPVVTRSSILDAALPLVGDEKLRANLTAKQAGQAGAQLGAETTDLPAVRAVLDNPPAPLVPGDNPTTAKLTGDPGIAAAEFTAQRGVGPIPERVTQQQAAAAAQVSAQNDARVAAIKSIEPAGDFGAADAALKAHGDAVEASQAANVAQVQGQAGRVVAGVDAAGQARVGDLTQAADQARSAIGGDLGPDAGGAIGKDLREPLDKANQAAWDHVMKLRDAVDPDGTLGTSVAPVRAAADAITQARGPYARDLSPDEVRILSHASEMPDVIAFKDLKEFRTTVTDASMKARLKGEPTGIYSDILNGVHKSIDNVDAVAPEGATITPPPGGSVDSGADAGVVGGAPSVGYPGAGIPGTVSGGVRGPGETPVLPERAGNPNEANRGGRLGSGDSGMAIADPAQAGAALTPFDAAANARYAEYRQAVRERGATFQDAPGVGQALQQGRFAGEFKTPDSALPNIIVKAGSDGADVAKAYLKAGGDPVKLSDAAAWSLRQAATRADGTLDPVKVGAWAKARSAFLSQIPEDANRFSAAADAQRAVETGTKDAATTLKAATAIAQTAVDDAMSARAATLKEMQRSAVGKFLGEGEPAATLWSVLNDKTMGAAKARQLKTAIGGDAAAEAGMRRMVGETIEKNLVGVPKGVTSEEGGVAANRFQNFMKHSGPALAELLSPEDIAKLKATNEMMIRDFRSAKVGTDSATGQLTAAGRFGVAGKMAGSLFRSLGGGGLGAGLGSWLGGFVGMPSIGGTIGAAAGVGLAEILQSAREAGIQNVADLKAAAYLNPALFRILATEVTPKNRGAIMGALNTTLRRSSLIGAMQGPSDQRLNQSGPPNNAMLH